LAEGIHPRRICVTGSPIREIYEHYRDKIANSTVLKDLGFKGGEYFLASVHRQENVDLPERLERVLDCLVAVRDEYKLPILVSTHPRTRKRLEELGRGELEGITFHEPFGYLDYNHLQMNAKCVISDSGTISEESAIMGFPAVSLRDSIERPESLDAGSMVLAGLEPDNLLTSIDLTLRHPSSDVAPQGYESLDFSDRVLKFVVSTATKHRSWSGLQSPN
jgi:UDP-N-acetylglucosamine 2-epimerase (non-hydrolysing)